jgi:lipopolysaccharide heptosyltransferase II
LSLNLSDKDGDLAIERISKVLVIRVDGLGDFVMSTPAFEAIREIFVDSHITLLAANWSKDLSEVMPFFDEVIYVDVPWIERSKSGNLRKLLRSIKQLRKRKFDLMIDLRGDFRNNILMFFCNAKYRIGYNITGCQFLLTNVVPLGENQHTVAMVKSLIQYLNPKNEKKYEMSLNITENDRELATKFLNQNGIINGNRNPLVVIHPGARWPGRRWVIKNYAEIADRLVERYDAKVIFTGSCDESKLTQDIVSLMRHKPIIATGKISLRQFLVLLERSNVFIGVDSGPMHMAAAMRTNVIALLGPARAEAIGPYGNGHIVITKQDNFTCSPCAQTSCKRPNNSCMQAIGVEEIWQAVKSLMRKPLREKNRQSHENNFD